MRIVSAQELENWLASGRVLEKDMRGPKVVALEDGRFLKIFHTRRHPLLARLFPAARRFQDNARQLAERGIAVPALLELLWIERQAGLSACLYQPMDGESLESILRSAPERIDALLPALAAFIHQLHRKGIYFRSLHLGNILLLPDGGFGLIDFLDLKTSQRPLGKGLVQRNFRHLQGYLQRRRLEQFPFEQLQALYRQQAG